MSNKILEVNSLLHTHEIRDFTLLEALASWTLAWVVAADEESMFEEMSSIMMKQIIR